MSVYKNTIKSSIRYLQLWRIAKAVNKKSPLALMYHGVTNNPDVTDWTQLSLPEFERQMNYIKEFYNIVKPEELFEMLKTGSIIQNTAILTFDDGYQSVFEHAFPILRKLNIPAAIYITSRFIRDKAEKISFLWPDRVKILIKSSGEKNLNLESFGLGQYSLISPEEKRDSIRQLNYRLKLIPDSFRKRVIDHLESHYGSEFKAGLENLYNPMSWNQVLELHNSGLFHIGAHTRNHPILSQTPVDELRDEILGSKNDLETKLNIKIAGFAYPNGRLQDISKESYRLVSENFDYAFTTESGRVTYKDNRYLLRRIGIGSAVRFNDFRILVSGAYYLNKKPLEMEMLATGSQYNER
ncbi:MAG: polysaccharide deacetylase family protein [candidate division Zixibacteria bacterium]